MNTSTKVIAVCVLLLSMLVAGCGSGQAVEPTITPRPTSTRTVIPTPINTPTPEPTAVLEIGSTNVSDKDGMTLVYVPEGEFKMGSENGQDMEKPTHTVYLDSFWVDRTEVTNAQYQRCVDAGACTPPLSTRSFTRDSYYGSSLYADYPVIFIDWNQASDYCQWAGRRLPTEAEWEKAARGTDERIYPWGNQSPDLNYLNYDSTDDTTAVGSYPEGASPYGALDMAGNVFEWVADWYGEGYYSSENDWTNPDGPSSGEVRVLRGGSWNTYFDFEVRSALRGRNDPSNRYDNVGFRCTRAAPETGKATQK